jgi:tetraacyldisaccharide 4'-kinase
MRAGWLSDRETSWGRSLLLAPLLPVSWLYGGAAALHRGLYARGLLARRRLAGQVVCVGNLVVGGTAKTPLSAWLARGLHRRGRKVALASRGYGGAGREPVTVVSDGRFVRERAESAGDEPMLLAARAAGVPVLVGRDRGLVGLRALSAFGADVLVLDDGFQHHRLERDLDLVCFDGRLGLGNGHVLPRGPLRERLAALRRADAIAVVDGPLPERDAARLAKRAPGARRIAVRRRPGPLRPLAGGRGEPAEALAGREVGLLSGLANPDTFRASVEGLGARVVAERRFPDHHAYRRRDLEGLAERAACWVTTEKDAVKILPAWTGGADVRVLGLSLEVEDAEAVLDWVESATRRRSAGQCAASARPRVASPSR